MGVQLDMTNVDGFWISARMSITQQVVRGRREVAMLMSADKQPKGMLSLTQVKT